MNGVEALAFPCMAAIGHQDFAPGLTKRELFAAMALQGLLAGGQPKNPDESKEISPLAVAYADALIYELSKPAHG